MVTNHASFGLPQFYPCTTSLPIVVSLGNTALCNLLEAVHHLVNVSDIQLVYHCLNLIFSAGPNWTVRAWSQREEIKKKKNSKKRVEFCKALHYFSKTSKFFYQCFLPASCLSIFRVGTASVTAVKVTQSVVHCLRFVPKQELLTMSITTAQTKKYFTQVSLLYLQLTQCLFDWNFSHTWRVYIDWEHLKVFNLNWKLASSVWLLIVMIYNNYFLNSFFLFKCVYFLLSMLLVLLSNFLTFLFLTLIGLLVILFSPVKHFNCTQVTFLLYAGWSSGAFSSINATQNVDLL